MGGRQSTQTGPQGHLGQSVGQATTAAAAALASAPGPAANTLNLAMANLQRQQGATVGGAGCDCDSYFGGNDSADPAKGLREYEASLSSKAKEDVIRRLARALKRAGINVDPEGDLDEIVRQLVSQIPNPKNGKTFSNDAKAQEKVCRVIADVLNDEFTPGVTKASEKFVDTSLSAVEMCRSVGEWAHSFASGVNVEFLAVHASVKNALRTIEILDQIMSEIFGKISHKLDESKDSKLSREVEPLSVVYHRAQNERRKQEELLKNILHVQLAPAAKELEIAMRDESEQNALIKRLGLKPGTSEFADSLAMAISGLGTAASIAQRVHKALKQVGASVSQYLSSSEFSEFQRMMDNKVESGEIPYDELAKFLEAVEELRRSFSDRNEPRFREALEDAGKTGGRRRQGGADDNKSSVVKRAERQETEKKVIVRDFAGRMSRHYDELLAAMKALGPRLGKEIPITDRTDALREALSRLSAVRANSQRVELALIGLYMDADARARKEQFISALRFVSTMCTAVMELEMYRSSSSYFARLKAAIDSIEKTVDYFADVITKKYGGRGIGGDGDGDDDDLDIVGGAGDDLLPEIARSALSLNEAVSEFAYFYYVAKVRSNLQQTSVEIESYSGKYVELLGDAVAARVYTLEQARTIILGRLTDTARARAGGVYAAAFGAPPGTADQQAFWTKTKEWINEEYNIKIRFYKALQAMDLYMKAFTTGIVKDPDAVRDIKKMLDGTQVIARWFSEETGNFIWKAFEAMPSTNFTNAKRPAAAGTVASGAAGDQHYYAKLTAVPNPEMLAENVGVPELGVNAGAAGGDVGAAKAKKNVSDAMEYFQALKNIVNAFARIGDKFGGRELRSQVFMSPTQIYKTLMDYLKVSAMSINAGTAAADAAAIVFPVQRNGQPENIIQVDDGVGPFQVFFGAIGVANLQGNYAVEDRYFALIIKAMAAKILTTLGVYDMFERATPIYDLTPTRMIVGGAFESDPEILDGAVELYFRLPRLAEFYRMFKWDGEAPADPFKIAMLPELEGVFSGLIRLIFQKMASPESGDYSDSELRVVIREVNSIYTHFRDKHSDHACQAALSAFVMEVNRRYGVVKAEDMKAYWKMVRMARTGEYEKMNNTNYAILPGEDEPDVERRAPSDQYAVGQYGRIDAQGNPINPVTGRPYEPYANLADLGRGLDTEWDAAGRRQMLRTFRRSIESEFEKVSRADFRKVSFSLLIKQAQAEIKRASTADKKLEVAFKLIQGTSVVGTNSNKAYMFHETVVLGLNALSVIESMVRQFDFLIETMNPVTIENELMDRIYERAQTNAAMARFHLVDLDNLFQLEIAAGRGGARLASRPAGYFNRYLVDLGNTASYHGRSKLPLNATPANLNAFEVTEYAWIQNQVGRMPPRRPSLYNDVANPIVNTQIPGEVTGQNWSADQIHGLRAMRLFARFAVNYNQIMLDYVENVFALMGNTQVDQVGTGQSLVDVRFIAGGGIQFSFAKLRGVAETLLSEVKRYLDLFRPFMPKSTISRFEDRSNAGSVYWIEEKLVDRYFRGSYSADLGAQRVGESATLEGLARRASDVLKQLGRETNVATDTLTNGTLTGIAGTVENAILALGANWPNATPGGILTRREDFGQAFSSLVFYNAVDVNSGLGAAAAGGLAPGAVATQYTLANLISTVRAPATPPTSAGGGALQRWMLYRSDNGPTPYRSLFFSFNQLLARYLDTLQYNENGERIYVNLINSFVNGAWAQSVNTGTTASNTWPDLVEAGQSFGLRGDPAPRMILFESLGYILQRLKTDQALPLNISSHLVSTLSEVPLHAKESFRANLPGFVKLFNALQEKCAFIKRFIESKSISVARPSQRAIATVVNNGVGAAADARIVTAGAVFRLAGANEYEANALNGIQPLADAFETPQMTARLNAIIDQISSAAITMRNAGSEVLKELGDNPVFLQTQEGSIESYKMSYGKMPLMPLSLSFWYLGNLVRDAANNGFVGDVRLYPRHVLGSTEFKLLYGVRQLLARSSPVGYEQLPSIKASLDAYNGVSSQREAIDEKRHLDYVQAIVAVLRFAVDSRNYKSLLTSTDLLFSAGSLVGGNENGIQPLALTANGLTGSAVFPLTTPLTDGQVIVTVVESSNQDEEAAKVTAVVGGGFEATIGDRSRERILNLIDMNIIPINVHALMRDIPLANLYNYEYTFEQMVASLYGEQSSRYAAWPAGLADNETRNTRQMMLRLLINPYVPVSKAMYGSDTEDLGTAGFVHRIFRGDNNLGMGRPKFLSDQLFNKALFGSIYQSQTDYDEAGPGVGAGISRGMANAVGPVGNAFRELSALSTELIDINTRLRAAVAQADIGNDANYGAANNALVVGQADPLATANNALADPNNRPALRTIIYNRFMLEIAALGRVNNRLLSLERVLRGGVVSAGTLAAIVAIGNRAREPDRLVQSLAAAIAAGNAAGFDVRFDRVANELDSGATAAGVRGLILAQLLDGAVPPTLFREANRELAANQRLPAAANWLGQGGPRASRLTYLKARDRNVADETVITEVNIGDVRNKMRLELIGKLRFDTYFVRKLFFITNIARMLRLKINRELTQSRSVLTASHMAVATSITEYGSDPFAPNESYDSYVGDGYDRNDINAETTRRGLPRFNDEDQF